MTNYPGAPIVIIIILCLVLILAVGMCSRNAARANIAESHLKLCAEQLQRGVIELQGCERMARECLEIRR